MIANIVLVVVGAVLVLVAFTDLVNTLVTTSSSTSRFADRWPSASLPRLGSVSSAPWRSAYLRTGRFESAYSPRMARSCCWCC